MRLKISHVTRYKYDSPVPYSLQQVRLTPKTLHGQEIIHWETRMEGGTKELEFDDYNNNHVTLLSCEAGQTEISIHSEGEVETTDNHGIVGDHGGFAPVWYFHRTTPLTQAGPGLRAFVKKLSDDFDNDITRMHMLSGAIHENVVYETGMTHALTTAEEALVSGHGVCQDHAHIFITSARLLGYPARYVSGYLMMDGVEQQEASHAWAEVYLPDIGWVGYDVSNNISPDARYVRLATGLDYKEAAPISGLRFGTSDETMIVSLQVQQ